MGEVRARSGLASRNGAGVASSDAPMLYAARSGLLASRAMTVDTVLDDRSRELVELVAGLSSVRMSDYSVVGAYMRFGEAVRERLKDARVRIAEACMQPAKRRDNHLLWAAPGSGKTYFVEQVAASLEGVTYQELNLAKLSEDDFRAGLDEAVSGGPTVCLVDEVDAKPDEPWPYEALMPFLDATSSAAAESCSCSPAARAPRSRSSRSGSASVPRARTPQPRPQENGWEIAPMDAGDRILVALSQMLGAADELERRVTEVEKLALYYVASAEHLANARQLREFAVRAVARGSASNDRIRYDDLFDSGDPENKRFWMSAMPVAEALEGSFVHIRPREPSTPARGAKPRPALPVPATRLVGRERELAEVTALLDDARLVTLTGPGGSGKTRLALEAATSLVDRYADGVYWVGLSALRDPALVTDTIEQAVGVEDDLAEFVGEQELLLLLDNFEQVMGAAPVLARLLASCPKLKLLVTSREVLRIGGEVEYPVPPLAEGEAVELFCERARLEPDESVAELCRRLDALPLALELAAARTSVLSPAQILDRLGQRLDLLKGGRDAEARQQTLRATIEWSHELLDEHEQRLFARLAVFRGGCTLETAEEVTQVDLDVLQSLVDKNLVRHTGERFWMLETVRTYARERLVASADEADLRRRHASAMLGMFQAAHQELADGHEHAPVYARVAPEHDNLRAALEWAWDSGEDTLLVPLAVHLTWFFARQGHGPEARMWLERRSTAPPPVRMRLLAGASTQLAGMGDYARSDALIAEWLQLAQEVGDEDQALGAMNSAALNAAEQGDLDRARSELTAIMTRAEETGNDQMVAFATVNLGDVAWRARDFPSSLEYSIAAVELFRERNDDGGVATSLAGCGWSSLALSDAARAEGFFREALAVGGPNPMASRRR
jgi:predicted ATPase